MMLRKLALRTFWLASALLLSILIPGHIVLAQAAPTDDIGAIYGDSTFFSIGGAACGPLATNESAAETSATNIDLSYKDSARSNRQVDGTAWLPPTSGTHPLIMFAPGRDVNSKSDGLYKRYLTAIAAQGYVVVGANFSDNNSDAAVGSDADDMKFLLTQVLSEGRLQGKIDSAAGIGLIGHSDGGMIALTVGYGAGDKKDTRITAVIAEDGAVGIGDVGPPLLLMHGDQDSGNTASIQAAYDSSRAPSTAFALFKGADHYHYITGAARGDNVNSYDKFHSAVDALTEAFLKRMLKKDTSDATNLSKLVAAQFSDKVTLSAKGNDTVTGGTSSPPTAAPAGGSCACPSNGSTPLSGSDNAQKAFNFFTQQGFTAIQAAGIVGNFMVESGPKLDPLADNGSHKGIAQWDTPGRFAHLQKFAAAKSPPLDPNSLDAQLQFVMEELGGDWKPAADDLKKQTTTASASDSWLKYYEGAVGQMDQQRRDNAKTALSTYGNGATDANASNTSTTISCASGSSGLLVGGYSLPVDKKWYDQHKEWFTKPHHDYPAADIPVPDGTPVFSMTAGKVLLAPNEGGYGEGVTIQLPDGTLFDYGHGSDGGSIQGAKQGDTVTAGQLIMHSNHTGSVQPPGPGGAHLHLDIKLGGKGTRCPQTLFVAIAENTPIPSLDSLPNSGCSN